MFALTENPRIYSPSEIEEVLEEYGKGAKIVSWKNKKYYNIPCAFDIETTSFYIDENGKPIDYATKQARKDVDINYNPEKRNIMYVWQFGLNGAVIIGRTWGEFVVMLNKIANYFSTASAAKLIIYVHNLGYEFQYIRKLFEWEKVFALEKYKPVYAITDAGIEFRCSMLLSGYSLAKVGDELQKYKVKKLVGDLDYSLLRHSLTPLTEKEIGYCVNDILVVMAYIQEQIEQYHDNIARIPLTNTGRVREFCRDACFYEPGKPRRKSRKRQQYKEFIDGLTMDKEEYKQLKRAFQGGFTHANANFVPFEYDGKQYEKIQENVYSVDFTSSYPAVMIAEQFPMGHSELIDLETIPEDERADFINRSMQLYCCVFDAYFVNLTPIIHYEHYLSESRCTGIIGGIFDNGRVVSADAVKVTLTEQDFFIMKHCYSWDKMEIAQFRRYQKGYLPRDFVKSILMLYRDKTTLKGVPGMEVEYLRSKGMLNSCYGMAVTDPCREEVTYLTEWKSISPDLDEALEKYNNSPNRFLFYAWGIWVTAYARRNLWSGILALKDDYIYSDTDSLKFKNYEAHKAYFEDYNIAIEHKLIAACKHHHFKLSVIRPATVKGVEKLLGVWDFEGKYKRFKTLGSKRYLVEDENGELHLTVAGLNKVKTVPYMLEQCEGDNTKVFSMFNDEMSIPAGYTGKSTHAYLDCIQEGELTDYTGQTAHYKELSSVHLEAAGYDLSLSREYIDFLHRLEEL